MCVCVCVEGEGRRPKDVLSKDAVTPIQRPHLHRRQSNQPYSRATLQTRGSLSGCLGTAGGGPATPAGKWGRVQGSAGTAWKRRSWGGKMVGTPEEVGGSGRTMGRVGVEP